MHCISSTVLLTQAVDYFAFTSVWPMVIYYTNINRAISIYSLYRHQIDSLVIRENPLYSRH